MDIETGIVGVKRGISWQSLREELYIEPAPGLRNTGSPSKHMVRGAAHALERAGLISIKSEKKQLIFKCLLSITGKYEKNKVRTKSARQVRTSQANKDAVSCKEVRTPKNEEVRTPLSIRDLKSTSSKNAASQNDDDDKNLIFSEKLKSNAIEEIGKLLKGFEEQKAQDMLDELAGQMSAHEIKYPIRYFHKILKSAFDGTFTKERAINVQAARQRQKNYQQQIKSSSEKTLANASSEKRQKSKPKMLLTEVLKQKNKGEM